MSGELGRPRARNGSTVLRTFRLPSRLNLVLQLEAKAKGLTPNALVSMIISEYADWGRFAARFGYVDVTRETLRSLLSLANAEQISTLARKIGAEVPREAVLFWFKEASINTFLSYLENICKFGRHAEYECEMSGDDYTITLRHDLGVKWSEWLRYSIDEALRKMFGIVAQFESSENEVILRFHATRNSKPADT